MRTEPEGFRDVPAARLASNLQTRMSCPSHLDPERLAELLRVEFNLGMPVSREDGLRILDHLRIAVNPPDVPPITPVFSGHNSFDEGGRRWVVHLNTVQSPRRQTQTIFHELYEVLRAYFQLWGGELPEDWMNVHHVPETYARWFAAAVTMPRPFVMDFVHGFGLDVHQLCELSNCSLGCVSRRLAELLHPDIPFAMVECEVPKYRLESEVPEFRCIDSVRSPEFSVRLNKSSGRKYHLPRKNEVWATGPLVSRVAESLRPVYARRVTGLDLFGWNDVSAMALPVIRSGRLVSVAIFATLPSDSHLFDAAARRVDAEVWDEVTYLTGGARKRAPRKDRCRSKKRQAAPAEQSRLVIHVATLPDEHQQLRWAFYEEDNGLEEFRVAA